MQGDEASGRRESIAIVLNGGIASRRVPAKDDAWSTGSPVSRESDRVRLCLSFAHLRPRCEKEKGVIDDGAPRAVPPPPIEVARASRSEISARIGIGGGRAAVSVLASTFVAAEREMVARPSIGWCVVP